MKTIKKAFVSNNVEALSAAEGIGKADPVPSVGAPDTPKDFVATKARPGARVQPADDLIKAAPGAAKEISSSTTYLADFALTAPDPATLSANLVFAAGWSGHYTKAEKWFTYVKEQTRLAWLQATPQLDELASPFSYARDRNDTISTQYASTAKLFDVRREPAVKGAAVRASKRAESGANAKGVGVAVVPATAVVPAASVNGATVNGTTVKG